MKTKTYILQAGFLPIGQTDVTGWRTYSFHTGRGAYDNAMAAYRSEMNRNKNPNVKYRIVSAYDTTRKDSYVPVFGFKSAARTL